MPLAPTGGKKYGVEPPHLTGDQLDAINSYLQGMAKSLLDQWLGRVGSRNATTPETDPKVTHDYSWFYLDQDRLNEAFGRKPAPGPDGLDDPIPGQADASARVEAERNNRMWKQHEREQHIPPVKPSQPQPKAPSRPQGAQPPGPTPPGWKGGFDQGGTTVPTAAHHGDDTMALLARAVHLHLRTQNTAAL